jgi:hypothetical protein
MRTIRKSILAILCTALLCAGCEKIELPGDERTADTATETTTDVDEETNDTDEEKEADGESTTDDNDTSNKPTSDNDTADTFVSVGDALRFTGEQEAIVSGYIVGYVAGTSISKAVFGLPTSGSNTNMLLADTPDETDVTRCMAVRLPTGGALAIRESLNLYDHPEYLHRKIFIDGFLKTYFKKMGIYNIYDYWMEEE